MYTCVVYNIALEKASDAYSQKLESKRFSEKMFELGWEITELENLNETGRKLLARIRSLCTKYGDHLHDSVNEITSSCLKSLRSDTMQCIKNIPVHQREPVTHVFVFMISPEARIEKPYALPICQFNVFHVLELKKKTFANF